jgi:tRNA-specific adenosine deaminase 1
MPQSEVPEPSYKTLQWVAFTTSIPFVGFGFMDNAILIVAGDAIDTTLGVMLGISTLCAAAIGNIISDLAGIGLGTIIEDFCANTLKLPTPNLTTAQRQLRSVRFATQIGTAVGMTFGCILGMCPLLFIDTHKADKLRKKAQLENLYQDVLLETSSLVRAEATTLYLRVNHNHTEDRERQQSDEGSSLSKMMTTRPVRSAFGSSGVSFLPYKPSATGEYLYAMYYALPETVEAKHAPKNVSVRPRDSIRGRLVSPSSSHKEAPHHQSHQTLTSLQHRLHERLIPVGRGIVSRAVLTGDTWNISNVAEEPDFSPFSPDGAQKKNSLARQSSHDGFRNMVVVPISDGRGRSIGVLEAINKIPKDDDEEEEDGFTDQDVEILKSLASHISVSLQVFYQDTEEAEMRLRDTIRIFKEIGIMGITDTGTTGSSEGGFDGVSGGDARSPGLFPTPEAPSAIPKSNTKSSKLFPSD